MKLHENSCESASSDLEGCGSSAINWNKYFYFSDRDVDNIFVRDVYKDVIYSKAFQRLKKIKFLGSIDYLRKHNSNKLLEIHSRYHHSLGVAKLALQYARERQLNDREEVVCVLSALLHDIGHGPLSHTLESVFSERFDVNHHITGSMIIKGEVKLGEELSSIFSDWKINPDEIISNIGGDFTAAYSELFAYGINIDTIEAILRCKTYMKGADKYDIPAPSAILSAYINRTDNDSQDTLDYFWKLKQEVYRGLINSREGVIADYVCKKYMEANINNFSVDHFYLTEDNLFEEHMEILKDLQNETYCYIIDLVSKYKYTVRNFSINDRVSLNCLDSINGRYVQSKELYEL